MKTRAHSRIITKYCRQLGTKFLRPVFKKRVAKGFRKHFTYNWFVLNRTGYFTVQSARFPKLSPIRICFLGEITNVMQSLHDLQWVRTIEWTNGTPAWLEAFTVSGTAHLRMGADWAEIMNSIVTANILVQMCNTFGHNAEVVLVGTQNHYYNQRLCRVWKWFRENFVEKAVATITQFFRSVVCSRKTKNAAMQHNRFLLGLLLNKIDSKRKNRVFSQDVKHCIAQFLL